MTAPFIDTDREVLKRYEQAAVAVEPALCCAVSYDPKYLEVIPAEIIERDYGCGDPTPFIREGDVVLDLGSGGGKACYIASQIVGSTGSVIGVDFNPVMLELAEKHRSEIANAIGWSNVRFVRAQIQDLKVDIDVLEDWLTRNPVQSYEAYRLLEAKRAELAAMPVIADDSVDVIVSNCVLNLVRNEEKGQLFAEMYRVLKDGGRLAISDIVADEEVPDHLKTDVELWSGCVSGAFEEREFLRAFEAAGFHGITIEKRDDVPWRTIEGIEFRSVTVTAGKGKDGPCWERNQAVIYQGPWREVTDDDGHTLNRGERTAVCDKTFRILTAEPYRKEVIAIEPLQDVPLADATPFDCSRMHTRHARETKGLDYDVTTQSEACCPADGETCC